MTISGLYYMCDNLGPASSMKIYQGRAYLGEFTYNTISYTLDQSEVVGFKVVDETNIIINIK